MNRATILMVDDETDFTSPVSKRLTKRGFTVLLASSGQEGLDLLNRETVDVVLQDISMPDMDGLKALSEIKKAHPSVEVIMLTAHARSDLVISSLGMGAYDYLMKPAEIGELIIKIEDAVHRRRTNLSTAPKGGDGQSNMNL